jgi:hypothetical protein
LRAEQTRTKVAARLKVRAELSHAEKLGALQDAACKIARPT